MDINPTAKYIVAKYIVSPTGGRAYTAATCKADAEWIAEAWMVELVKENPGTLFTVLAVK